MSLMLVLIMKGVVKGLHQGIWKKAGLLASTLALLGLIGRSQVFIHTAPNMEHIRTLVQILKDFVFEK